ncbi:MAG: DivIVA domain-containing protein [Actinomycetota bacterium]
MATEIDLPFLPSAAQIRRREFASVRRGYDPDQVRDYLTQVAEQIETLEQELRDSKLKPASGAKNEGHARPSDPPPSEDPYERLSKRLTTLLATADKEAEGILGEARADAARMLDEARSEADRIRVDAQARAEEARQQGNELLERAKQEADRVVLGLSERRETLVQHLQDMQTRLVGVARELEVAIEDPAGVQGSRPAEADTPNPVSEPASPQASTPSPAPAETEHRTDPRDADDEDRPADGIDAIDGLEGMLMDDGIEMPGIPSLELDFDDDSDD